MTPPEYALALSPLRLGEVELPNRIVRTAHGTGMGSAVIGDDLIAFHVARADGGTGCTILEATSVHPSGHSPTGMRSWDDSAIDGYVRLKRALAGRPMRVMVQLFHGGFTAPPIGGGAAWSASTIPSPDTGVAGIAMSHSQIDEVVAAFAAAARRAMLGGLDGVEIHAGHGYLLGQFLSPLTNHRDDDYGRTPEGRRRFLLEVMRATRSAVPAGFPVGVRVSAADGLDGGLEVADTSSVVGALEAEGLIDFVDISYGSRYAYDQIIGGAEQEHGYELQHANPIADAAGVPAIVAGRIRTLQQAEQILRDGHAALVSMVRATIADPDLLAKSVRGAARQVRPCIGCNQGCVGGLHGPSGRLGCVVNPMIGNEKRPVSVVAVTDDRPVVVIGGGPCGMEAARVAATAGRRVVLHEATEALGGQLTFARRAPHRADIGEIADWHAAELDRLGVDVRLGSSVTPEDAAALDASAIVVATGSRPRRDGFQMRSPARLAPGADLPHVHTSWDVFGGACRLTGHVVVVDDVGHYEGVAVAEQLLDQGATVTLVSSLARMAPLLQASHVDEAVKRRLLGPGFSFEPDVVLAQVTPTDVTVATVWNGHEQTIPADAVVLVTHNVATGAAFADRLTGSAVHIAGDALSPRFLQIAIAEGHAAARAIVESRHHDRDRLRIKEHA